MQSFGARVWERRKFPAAWKHDARQAREILASLARHYSGAPVVQTALAERGQKRETKTAMADRMTQPFQGWDLVGLGTQGSSLLATLG